MVPSYLIEDGLNNRPAK